MRLKSLRARLTALYLVFFSAAHSYCFSIFLYGQLSRSLIARLDDDNRRGGGDGGVLFPR